MRFSYVIAAALLAGCGGKEDRPPPSSSIGQAGASGSGGSGSASSGNGGGSEGSGGQGGQGDPDAGAPTEAGPSDPPCLNDIAFWASGMAFTAPTPEPLGLALSELAYDPASHPISIILAAKGGFASATLGASATTDDGMGAQIFPKGQAPDRVPAALSFGGFESGAPQAVGYLHLVDQAGPIDIELNEVSVKVTTQSGCSTMTASLSARIPVSEGGKALHRKDGSSKTIAELGEGPGGGGLKDAGKEAWEIRALFSGETMSFDFASL